MRAQRSHGLTLEPQQPVGIVLDDEQAGLLADPEHLKAARTGHGHACRVVVGRDCVEELDPAPLRGHPPDGRRERLWNDPGLVHGHMDDLGLICREGA